MTPPAESTWRSRDQIRAVQWRRLRAMLDAIVPANRFWTSKFGDASLDVSSIRSLDDLGWLPFTVKQELVDDQLAHPPYGTNLTFPTGDYTRLHQTSGTTGRPLRWLDTRDSWQWFQECWRQIYLLCDVTDGDRVFLPFSFGPFIGFWAAFEGAAHLNALRIAGGGMSSEVRLRVMVENSATVVCCTPTYALRLAEVADECGFDLAGSSVSKLIVAGEPGGSIPTTRKRIEDAWGARVFDHWGMTEIGSLAVESVAGPRQVYLLETECIPEVLDPESLEPVRPGEQGELVITNLGRIGSPLIRYRTGDLVRAGTVPCPEGYDLLRLDGGILGRADDMVTIRGNNLFPSSIEAVLREFDEIVEYRVDVETRRNMAHVRIRIEPDVGADWDSLRERIDRSIRNRLGFQAEITRENSGALPRFELKGQRFFRADDVDMEQ